MDTNTNGSTTDISTTARLAGCLIAAVAVEGLAASCAPGAPGDDVLGDELARTNGNVGPGALDGTIEEYLFGRAHQIEARAPFPARSARSAHAHDFGTDVP